MLPATVATSSLPDPKKEIHVEICSKCHPFYTGQQKATSHADVLISLTVSMV
ncbi:MAG: 50S ribosomal protein L31 [Lachnospiraceae bacterium]